eukprot:10687892-Prorocentrum_lima.AAC.1
MLAGTNGVLHPLQHTSSFQHTAWASPIASLTTARLVPVVVLGKLGMGIRKWEAPESHIADGSPGSLIRALWM